MDWVQLMKNKPAHVVLAVATLIFGGSRLTITTEQATIDSLNLEIVKVQKDILYIERDTKRDAEQNKRERAEDRAAIKKLTESLDNFKTEIRRLLTTRKPQ